MLYQIEYTVESLIMINIDTKEIIVNSDLTDEKLFWILKDAWKGSDLIKQEFPMVGYVSYMGPVYDTEGDWKITRGVMPEERELKINGEEI